MMDGNSRNELIMGPLAGSFDAAMKNPDFKNVLNEFLDTFKSFNQWISFKSPPLNAKINFLKVSAFVTV